MLSKHLVNEQVSQFEGVIYDTNYKRKILANVSREMEILIIDQKGMLE